MSTTPCRLTECRIWKPSHRSTKKLHSSEASQRPRQKQIYRREARHHSACQINRSGYDDALVIIIMPTTAIVFQPTAKVFHFISAPLRQRQIDACLYLLSRIEVNSIRQELKPWSVIIQYHTLLHAEWRLLAISPFTSCSKAAAIAFKRNMISRLARIYIALNLQKISAVYWNKMKSTETIVKAVVVS